MTLQLACISVAKKDVTHVQCGRKATLGCIEYQLWKQKQSYNALDKAISELAELEKKTRVSPESMRLAIEKNVAAIEELDRCLTTLVALFLENVGRVGPSSCILKKLWSLIKGPFATPAINDDEIERLKKTGE